ncbi:MAG: hypothetical protein MUC59_05575 [Saprospiraceae bacterium]|jgi:cell fate regulator YaaT (PSP1 superfamily)|nr:hypothetical protein [Saprospiraceae bacterium]
MACAGCSVGSKEAGAPSGCGSKGSCASGSCNRLNTFDWLTTMEIEDVDPFQVVEVSFKNGSRKAFYFNQPYTRATTGDMVVVDTQAGCDVGRISLSGELVRLQMRKKRIPVDGYFPKVVRKANERDLEKLDEVRNLEKETMIRARAIARSLNLNMKIGDVEYQGDGKKATFYYTADGRVDFRELIRQFAKDFKMKIEMRQIGARQEASRVGGIGPCGRELCCSTWLTSYKTVGTAAARYQNLAINQAKLSGQCGRLKCCLNYELDTYMEALSSFPDDADKLKTKEGMATLVKTDIFKGLMYYGYEKDRGRGALFALAIAQVRSVRDAIKKGELPESLASLAVVTDNTNVDDDEPAYNAGDLTGVVELPPDERKKKKKKKKPSGADRGGEGRSREARPESKSTEGGEGEGIQTGERKEGGGNNRDRNRGRGRDRGDRRPSGGGDANAQAKPQEPREPRPPREPQAPREPREPREPRQPGQEGDAPTGERREGGNRRGGRGGKNRRGGRGGGGGRGGNPPGGGAPPSGGE